MEILCVLKILLALVTVLLAPLVLSKMISKSLGFRFVSLQPQTKASVGYFLLPIMAYTGRLHPKGVPFSGFRCMKG